MDVILPLLQTIDQVNGHGTHPSELLRVDSGAEFPTRQRGLYVDTESRLIHFAETDAKTIRMMQRSIELVLGGQIEPADPTQTDCVTFTLPPVFEELDDAPVDA